MTSFLLSIKLSIHLLTEFSHTIMRRWGAHQQMKLPTQCFHLYFKFIF